MRVGDNALLHPGFRMLFTFPSKSRKPKVEPRLRVLMVCMGNICRSPTAEAVLRHKLALADLAHLVEVDSAGTHAFHVGSAPDKRSQTHAHQRGYDLSALRARRVSERDFLHFDLVLAMDWDNLALLEDLCPPDRDARQKLRRLTEFVPAHSPFAGAQVVPDPYYGGPDGFDAVLDLVEAACDGVLLHIQSRIRVVDSGKTLG